MIGSRDGRGAPVQGVAATPPRHPLRPALPHCIHPMRGGYRAYCVRVAARYGDTLVTERGVACMIELLLKLNHSVRDLQRSRFLVVMQPQRNQDGCQQQYPPAFVALGALAEWVSTRADPAD